MKTFLFQVSIFMLIVVALVCGNLFLLSKTSFKIPPDKHIIVIGDSFTECAIDDAQIPHFLNISQSASAYLYSFCKLRKFFEENHHIDTVLLSFHYHGLTKESEDRWLFSDLFMNDKIPKTLLLFQRNELGIFPKTAILQAAFKSISVFSFRLRYESLNLGGHLHLDKNNLQTDIFPTSTDTVIGIYQKEYLLKIVELCRAKNVELILIATPTYKPDLYGELGKVYAFYNTYLQGIKYLDYSAFPLADSCYADIPHLNYKGAAIFSAYLRDNWAKDLEQLP
jgi:hypothetical protein